MKVIETEIPDVLLIEPQVFGDDRGFFFESFNQKRWQEQTGLETFFVQQNHSKSAQNVLRGLHYQIQQTQGKLVRALVGEIFDVAVDLRRSSPSFGKWAGARLSAENKQQLWVPEGFAHGFVVLSPVAEVLYLATDYYAPEHERAIIWNDKDIQVEWPHKGIPLLSGKDQQAVSFNNAETFA